MFLDSHAWERVRDIVILVLGQTGAGKSSFINSVLGRSTMVVGTQSEPCTIEITSAELDVSQFLQDYPWLKDHRVLLVDTPGLDRPDVEDSETWKHFDKWMKDILQTKKVVIGGMVYLHDIMQDRFDGNCKQNLSTFIGFNRRYDQSAADRVILGITKASVFPIEEASRRISVLETSHWKNIIADGARVMRVEHDQSISRRVIEVILQRFKYRDIVIPVMGQIGSGKSTFINAAVGRICMDVSSEMDHRTVAIATAEVDISNFPQFHWLKGRRLLLVDTPGIDDAYTNVPEVWQKLESGLGNSYREKMILGGVIFLRDITQDRFSGSARKSIILLNQLCRKDTLKKLALGITKADRLTPEEAQTRERLLKDVHWKELVDHGAHVQRLDKDNSIQALELVQTILDRFSPEDIDDIRYNDNKATIDHSLTWKNLWALLSIWTIGFGKFGQQRNMLGR